jgi:hypothetical protein
VAGRTRVKHFVHMNNVSSNFLTHQKSKATECSENWDMFSHTGVAFIELNERFGV